MDTTTLTAFWTGFTSTTVETLFGNYNFFGMLLICAVSIMLLGGLYYTMTMFFKRKRYR